MAKSAPELMGGGVPDCADRSHDLIRTKSTARTEAKETEYVRQNTNNPASPEDTKCLDGSAKTYKTSPSISQ